MYKQIRQIIYDNFDQKILVKGLNPRQKTLCSLSTYT